MPRPSQLAGRGAMLPSVMSPMAQPQPAKTDQPISDGQVLGCLFGLSFIHAFLVVDGSSLRSLTPRDEFS